MAIPLIRDPLEDLISNQAKLGLRIKQMIVNLEFSGLEVAEYHLDTVRSAYAYAFKECGSIPDLISIYENYYDSEVESFYEFMEFNELECTSAEDDEPEFDADGMPVESAFIKDLRERVGDDFDGNVPSGIMIEVMSDCGFTLFEMDDVIKILNEMNITYRLGDMFANHSQYDVFGNSLTRNIYVEVDR